MTCARGGASAAVCIRAAEDVWVTVGPIVVQGAPLDGVTEVADASGARLGETELFERSLSLASKSGASDFVSSVSAMLYSYVGDSPLKDDVTILAAKVGRLWD